MKLVGQRHRVVLGSEGAYVANTSPWERMEVRVKGGTYIVDMQCGIGEVGPVALDSGAVAHVCLEEARMASNTGGMETHNLGRVIRFRGDDLRKSRV